MALSLRLAAVLAICLLASACTVCGDWSSFNTFPKVCHSEQAK